MDDVVKIEGEVLVRCFECGCIWYSYDDEDCPECGSGFRPLTQEEINNL